MEVALSVDFEFEFDLLQIRHLSTWYPPWCRVVKAHLPIRCGQRNPRKRPSSLRWPVRSQTDVPVTRSVESSTRVYTYTMAHILVSTNDGVTTEIEPTALEVGIKVWLSLCQFHPSTAQCSVNRARRTGVRLWVRSYERRRRLAHILFQ